MKIKPGLKALFKEISDESVNHANQTDSAYKYRRRILQVFKRRLTEQEQIYVLTSLMEFVHYRNVMTDPEHQLTLSNVKLRTYLFIAFLTVIVLITAAILLKTNEGLNGIIEMFNDLFQILTV